MVLSFLSVDTVYLSIYLDLLQYLLIRFYDFLLKDLESYISFKKFPTLYFSTIIFVFQHGHQVYIVQNTVLTTVGS